MKYIIVVMITFVFYISSEAQVVEAIKIKGKGYEGYAFPESHFVYGINFDGSKSRITPSEEQIRKAEVILKDSIESIIKKRTPNITRKTLGKYKRQYLGFVNEKGEIIIFINLLRGLDKRQNLKLKEDICQILDGGDDYWEIYINIDNKESFGLSINAES